MPEITPRDRHVFSLTVVPKHDLGAHRIDTEPPLVEQPVVIAAEWETIPGIV